MNNTVKDYIQIAKLRLSFSVVLSSAVAYLLAIDDIIWVNLAILIAGGFSLVASSNVFNQLLEIEQDSKMDRTKNRPLPTDRMKPLHARIYGSILGIIGLICLYILSPKAAFFGALSLLLYVLAYTPLKGKTPWAVFVGSFPGAIPFMLGWVAATNEFGVEAGVLFAIQFVWQFPHFWAIAWLLFDDYKKANYFLLPNRKKDNFSAIQIILYTLILIPLSVFPLSGMTGNLTLNPISGLIITILGLVFLQFGILLAKNKTKKSARNLVIASVIYLPLVQIVYLIDKFYM